MSELKKLYTETVPEDETVECWAQFNKITGEFISTLQLVDLETLNQDFFNYKKVEINLEKQIIKGTYDNFQIVDKQDQPLLMTETALNNAAQFKIDKTYGIYQRLEIQENLLEKLATALNVEDDAFLEMRDFIAEVKSNNNLIKESLINDPAYTYVSLAEEVNTLENQLEGGLHELIGPRQLNPTILATPEV